MSKDKKVDILKKNIFGVDLDPKAVDIAQLNLLLKAAAKKQRLPTLKEHIQCGNSLIEDDEFAGKGKGFNWNERFRPITTYSDFDVVIGNPPYVRTHKLDAKEKQYFWKNLQTFKAKSDLYSCFMEKGIKLLKYDGMVSFIVPDTWTSLESFYEIRKFILDNCLIIKLAQLPKKVFQTATVKTCVFVLRKENDLIIRENNKIIVERLNERGEVSIVKRFSQSEIYKNHLYNFQLYSEQEGKNILDKIKKSGEKLSSLIEFFYGLKTGDDNKFVLNESKNKECMKLIRSKDIKKYSIHFNKKYVWYIPELMIKNKPTARPGKKDRFETEKIIVARMGKEVVATYDDEHYYVKDGMLLLKKNDFVNLKYILGLLNSKVINYYYQNYFITIDVLKNALLDLPIKMNERIETEIVSLVDKMLSLNRRLNEIGDKKTDERARIEEYIKRTDEEIDELVYRLYGITEKEKKIIEESLR